MLVVRQSEHIYFKLGLSMLTKLLILKLFTFHYYKYWFGALIVQFIVSGTQTHGTDCSYANNTLQANCCEKEAIQRIVPVPFISLPHSNRYKRETKLHAHDKFKSRCTRFRLLDKAWNCYSPGIGHINSKKKNNFAQPMKRFLGIRGCLEEALVSMRW